LLAFGQKGDARAESAGSLAAALRPHGTGASFGPLSIQGPKANPSVDGRRCRSPRAARSSRPVRPAAAVNSKSAFRRVPARGPGATSAPRPRILKPPGASRSAAEDRIRRARGFVHRTRRAQQVVNTNDRTIVAKTARANVSPRKAFPASVTPTSWSGLPPSASLGVRRLFLAIAFPPESERVSFAARGVISAKGAEASDLDVSSPSEATCLERVLRLSTSEPNRRFPRVLGALARSRRSVPRSRPARARSTEPKSRSELAP
jgi:hypothetical protein